MAGVWMLPASVDTMLVLCWASVTGVGLMAGMVDTLKTRSLFKHTCSPDMPKQNCKPIFKPTLFQLCFKAGNVGPAIIPCYLNLNYETSNCYEEMIICVLLALDTRKHDTSTQCWLNVGPPSSALAQQ